MKNNNGERIDGETIRVLSKKAMCRWLADVSFDWAVIVSAIAVFFYKCNPITFLAALLIVGNRQHALAILGHDGTHFTLSKNKKLNDLITNFLAMWPIGLTVSGYRILHFKHHHSVGTMDDPELGHKRARSPQWDLPATPLKVLKYAFFDILGCSIPDYIIIVTYSKPARKADHIPLFLWHGAAITGLACVGLWQPLLVWYGSLATTFMMFFRLRLWLEHQGITDTHRIHLNFWQGALLAPHKSWLHWEHHKWMSIPYHRLETIRSLSNEVKILTLSELVEWFANSPPLRSGNLPTSNDSVDQRDLDSLAA